MFFYTVVLAIVVCLIGSSSSGYYKVRNHSLRWNAEATRSGYKIQNYPHLVSVLITKNHRTSVCGGSIINSDTILTAARCLKESDIRIRVRSGSTFFSKQGIATKVKSFHKHPSFDPETNVNDIAVLKLESKLQMNSKTKPVRLAERGRIVTVGTKVMGVGWSSITGEICTDFQIWPEDMKVLPRKDCLKYYSDSEFTEKMSCVGPDECASEYGTPFLDAEGFQVGIASDRQACYDPSKRNDRFDGSKEAEVVPSTMTNVADYLDFIMAISNSD